MAAMIPARELGPAGGGGGGGERMAENGRAVPRQTNTGVRGGGPTDSGGTIRNKYYCTFICCTPDQAGGRPPRRRRAPDACGLTSASPRSSWLDSDRLGWGGCKVFSPAEHKRTAAFATGRQDLGFPMRAGLAGFRHPLFPPRNGLLRLALAIPAPSHKYQYRHRKR
jgi:hypothetical protein